MAARKRPHFEYDDGCVIQVQHIKEAGKLRPRAEKFYEELVACRTDLATTVFDRSKTATEKAQGLEAFNALVRSFDAMLTDIATLEAVAYDLGYDSIANAIRTSAAQPSAPYSQRQKVDGPYLAPAPEPGP